MEALGAKRFADRVDVHKEDLPAIDRWLSGVTTALSSMSLKSFEQLGGKLPLFLCLHMSAGHKLRAAL